MHSRKHCTVYYTAFFSVIEKKIWNQIWIPKAIFYKVILTTTIYHAIWRHKLWFSDYFSFFFVLHQISRAKKHDTGHSDPKSSRLWVNIRIWDEFWVSTVLFIAVCKFWHFFFHINLLDFPLASCLINSKRIELDRCGFRSPLANSKDFIYVTYFIMICWVSLEL